MRFVAVTCGTEGDVRPLAAVCRALLDAGHEAQLLADASTLGSAQQLGVPTVPLSGDAQAEHADTSARARVLGERMAEERGTVAAVHALEAFTSK